MCAAWPDMERDGELHAVRASRIDLLPVRPRPWPPAHPPVTPVRDPQPSTSPARCIGSQPSPVTMSVGPGPGPGPGDGDGDRAPDAGGLGLDRQLIRRGCSQSWRGCRSWGPSPVAEFGARQDEHDGGAAELDLRAGGGRGRHRRQNGEDDGDGAP